ncbi:Protoglobin-domain-containing protein [Schizophyllum amplum]|uniref:Protoglobin-domain-containing protein n=1 Tax=Schizophyllum amplum TaxID=97359 RepID=A0A550CNH7_9AGAR|nr:Protoglobin-domain-containing protein [Auriculariopsis ampla]
MSIDAKLASIDLSADKPLEDGQRTPQAEGVTCPVTGLTATGKTCPFASAGSPENLQEVDEEALRTDINARMVYLKDFVNFTRRDEDAIRKVGPLVNELIPEVVDALYSKLFEFDVTKQVFMQRNDGFDGPMPTKLDDLALDSPQLVYRKVFMKNWCRRLLSSDFSSPKTFTWMDKVGVMHTGVKSFKHRTHVSPLHVPYRDCALTLGWVGTVLQTATLQLPEDKLPMQGKIEAVAAINKILWIQNDLFARHYIDE